MEEEQHRQGFGDLFLGDIDIEFAAFRGIFGIAAERTEAFRIIRQILYHAVAGQDRSRDFGPGGGG